MERETRMPLPLPRSTTVTPLLQAALEYAETYRLLIIPLEPGEKRPAFKTGPNHSTLATLNPEIITGWWNHKPFNIGLPCTPNRLAVIDVDGPEGAETLHTLEAEHGPLPTTWMQSSMRADRPSEQYVYRWPANEMVPTRAISPQLEVRAHGAQIVVPPSQHPTGSSYTWLVPPSDMPAGPPELPAWVLDLLTRPTQAATHPQPVSRPATLTSGQTVASKRLDGLVAALATTPEGNRNQMLNHAAYTAARIPGLTDDQITARLTTAAQTIGLEDKEITATIRSGLTAGHRDGADPEHHEPIPVINTQPTTTPSVEVAGPTGEWAPVDLTALLDGTVEHLDPPPNILTRSDGISLLYTGELNWISGEPETGKSWIAQLAAIQEIQAGNHVLYIDLEDTPSRIVDRLIHLDITTQQIAGQFHYIRPTIGATGPDLTALLDHAASCTLAVIDGTTDLHLIHGLSPEDNKDAATLVSQLLRPLANAGPAVLPLDHVTKNKETRGRYAIGAQHKLAAVRGAAYQVETITPMGRGTLGQARLYITKDRPGHIRGTHTLRQGLHKHNAGDFYLDATTPDITLRIAPPAEAAEFKEAALEKEIIEFVTEYQTREKQGAPTSAIEKGVIGKTDRIREAIGRLVDENRLINVSPGRYPRFQVGGTLV